MTNHSAYTSHMRLNDIVYDVAMHIGPRPLTKGHQFFKKSVSRRHLLKHNRFMWYFESLET